MKLKKNLSRIFYLNPDKPSFLSFNTNRLSVKAINVTVMCTYFWIFIKNSKKKIGEIHLFSDGEIFYLIDNDYRNNGYATEAVDMLIKLSNIKVFTLSISPNNKASIRVAEKLKFIKKGRTDDDFIIYNKHNRRHLFR